MTPILIANIKPFRIIARDEGDVWNPTIEEINSCTYDYVKLHRTSKVFDAHLPFPLPAFLTFDGSLLFPFVDCFKNGDVIVDEVNRILASILLGGIYVEAVSPLDISRGKLNETGYFRISKGISCTAQFHQAIGERTAGAMSTIKLMDCEVLYATDVIDSYNQGHVVLDKLERLSPSLFINGFSYFQNHQINESLANTWICIEQVLESIWDLTVLEEAKKINIAKRKRFIESQQWNAAHKVEVLFQREMISESLYGLLSIVRSARNDFLHKGKKPSYESAHSGLLSLIGLIEIASELQQVIFNKGDLEKHLPENIPNSIPSTNVPTTPSNKPLDVKYWMSIRPIPGDDGWEGEYESFSDITLVPIDPETTKPSR
ncbi:MAG: hypothetical protein PF450_15025 [Bacteroidales bacterium]|jgi:hypothetical protein|nr:hypothetical protein [Bacteroidales bacterium]